MIKSALAITLLAFLIASCGRSGSLYLPNKTDNQAEKTTEKNVEKTKEKATEKSPIKDSKKIIKQKAKPNFDHINSSQINNLQ